MLGHCHSNQLLIGRLTILTSLPQDAKYPDSSCFTSSNGANDQGSTPCSFQGSASDASSPIPHGFTRVSKDSESTCARTEVVYVHPNKVCVCIVTSHPKRERRTSICACRVIVQNILLCTVDWGRDTPTKWQLSISRQDKGL